MFEKEVKNLHNISTDLDDVVETVTTPIKISNKYSVLTEGNI